MNLKFPSNRHFKLNMHGAFGFGFGNWIRVLYNNNFTIELKAIPKVLWISMSILSTQLFTILEYLRFDEKVKKVAVQHPVFILGYSRSGTTFLHYLLSKDRQFSYCATYQVLMPNLFLTLEKWLKKILAGFMPKKRPMDNLKLDTHLPKEEEFALSALSDASMVNGYYFPKNIMRYFKRYVMFDAGKSYEKEWKDNLLFFLKKVTLKEGPSKLLIKSPFNTGRVKQLLELFPDAKFIHIHRNPIEVYYSNEKLYESILPAFAFHEVENDFMEKFILDSYKQVYDRYYESISLIPSGNLVTISYESLTSTTLDTLKSVYDGLGLTGFEEALPFIKEELSSYNDYKKNIHSMSTIKGEHVQHYWADIIKKMGYTV